MDMCAGPRERLFSGARETASQRDKPALCTFQVQGSKIAGMPFFPLPRTERRAGECRGREAENGKKRNFASFATLRGYSSVLYLYGAQMLNQGSINHGG